MSNKTKTTVNIVGAGLSGLSAAVHLAQAGIVCRLISRQPSERAQSVLAEGGINGALNTMGEDDCTENHFRDTLKAGCDIADPEAVKDLTEHAPSVIWWLSDLGAAFQRKGDVIQQRNFGGQKKKRTAYAQSSIGKILMTALIDETRKYEAQGLVKRYSRHDFTGLLLSDDGTRCTGLVIRDRITGECSAFSGPVLMASGGLNGLFPGMTTGTTANTGDAAAQLFSQGVVFSSLEMIQFHPTTLQIPDKCLLVSEAARGEGGKVFIYRGKEKWFFMEEKYPELGSLMPRDVVSREEYRVMHDPALGGQVYLDCTKLSREIWKKRLPDLRKEVLYYTGLDAAKSPIPIEPGIHYFMGGIDTDLCHRTNIRNLYASGECCSLYHGANRLGGNSTLGAVYGGQKAAQTIAAEISDFQEGPLPENLPPQPEMDEGTREREDAALGSVLIAGLGVVRNGKDLEKTENKLFDMLSRADSERARKRILLGIAMTESAIYRKESRGAHWRTDFPDRDDEKYKGMVTAQYNGAADLSISIRRFQK